MCQDLVSYSRGRPKSLADNYGGSCHQLLARGAHPRFEMAPSCGSNPTLPTNHAESLLQSGFGVICCLIPGARCGTNKDLPTMVANFCSPTIPLSSPGLDDHPYCFITINLGRSSAGFGSESPTSVATSVHYT